MTKQEAFEKAKACSKTGSVHLQETVGTTNNGLEFGFYSVTIDDVSAVGEKSYRAAFDRLTEKFSNPIEVEKEQLRNRLRALGEKL